MLAIKNNIMAANAARYLSINYDALAKSIERLSSGLRINSAKDDAAGLAVRELMRSDIAVLNQGSRNAQDGVSMLQTMEGAMGAIDEALVRMRQLAEQAATGTYSEAQRAIMNSEFGEMAEEIERIATTTEFNSIKMLNNTDPVNIRFGAATADAITITGKDMSKDALGIGASIEYVAGLEGVTDPTVAWVDNSTGGGTETFQITFGAEPAITTSAFDATTFSMNDVADKINQASRATTSKYDAAEVVYDSETGQYKLKISAKAGGALTPVIVTDFAAGSHLGPLLDDWLNIPGSGTDLSIDTVTKATAALANVTTAIGLKDEARAAFGYKMNRLESTVGVINIQAENLMAAESRISDVDVATEMAAMTRNQVLAQAGISMLAQANAMPTMALTLLR